MSNNDSIQKTITVALLLCVVCSVIVSTAAVLLRPAQVANKSLDFKRNVLAAAGLYDPAQSVEAQFANITTRIVDLESGQFSEAVDVKKYDQRKAAKDPSLSKSLSADVDIAKIGSQEKYAKVYLADDGKGGQKVILPVRGYGLWSTLRGFLALEADLSTVIGLGFYDHKETPGLGGEVDNPRWKSLWQGKQVYNTQGDVALQVIKGSVNAASKNAQYQVDGLSGATLTSRGVSNLVQFWMGQNGFGPFLTKLKNGEA